MQSNIGYFNPIPNTPYRVLSVLDNKAFTVQQGTNKIVLQDYTNAPNQQFLVFNNNGKYALVCNGSGICVQNDSNDDGTSVLTDLNQHKSSFFEVVPVAQGVWAGKACYIKTFTGKALSLKGGQPVNNT